VNSCTFTVPASLPGLNEYTDACRRSAYAGNCMKKQAQQTVRWGLNAAHLEPIPADAPVRVTFLWIERDRRRDLDNVAFAKKFILDELVEAGVLTKDSRKHVEGFDDQFPDPDRRRPRVVVTIERTDG
jgi:hypothetical protein